MVKCRKSCITHIKGKVVRDGMKNQNPQGKIAEHYQIYPHLKEKAVIPFSSFLLIDAERINNNTSHI